MTFNLSTHLATQGLRQAMFTENEAWKALRQSMTPERAERIGQCVRAAQDLAANKYDQLNQYKEEDSNG